MRIFFVVNPTAGQGRTSIIWSKLEEILHESDIEFAYGITDGPNDATKLTKKASESEYEIIVGVGGDGTLNEIVQALPSHCKFGIIPTGTGNDLAYSLNIPHNPYNALALLLNQPKEYLIDLPLVNGKPFVNMVGVGFDAAVAKQVKEHPPKGRGKLPYLLTMFGQLITYQSPMLRIEVDDEVIEQRTLLVAVGNGKSCGGGLILCPHAKMDDELFDVCIVRELSKFDLLRNIPKVFRGTHLSHPGVKYMKAKRVRIAGVGVPVHADGEPLGCTPVELSFQPKNLCVLVPN